MPKLTLNKKCKIVEEAQRTNNIRGTARKYHCYPSQIRHWRTNYEQLKSCAENSPAKQTLHKGKDAENPELETALYEWILAQPEDEIFISTQDIVDKAVSIFPIFKDNDSKKLKHWEYEFMCRKNLTVRTRTRVAQVLDREMQSFKRDYCSRLMRMYLYRIKNPHFFVNMDQTAVYLNCSPKRIVDRKGKKTISIRVGGTAYMRFTLCVAVAMDGTKLLLFVIFKGKPNGNIEKNLSGILPAGVFGCTQSKAWCDERAMHK